MLHHPWFFVETIARTLGAFGTRLLREVVAQVPLWSLPVVVVVVAFALLATGGAVADTHAAPVLGWRSRALLAGIAVVTFVTLMLLAYTGWNAVGSPRVEAFQGRYLLPLLRCWCLATPSLIAPAGARARSRTTRWRSPSRRLRCSWSSRSRCFHTSTGASDHAPGAADAPPGTSSPTRSRSSTPAPP